MPVFLAGKDKDEMLTTREREILQLLADGMSNADVATKLFISQETVKSHVRHILAKLEADTARTQSRSPCGKRSSISDPARHGPTEEILAAEQDERRRIALFLHDGPVQSLSGVALMLDAALSFLLRGETEQSAEVLDRALRRTRTTIGELRDLSFNLEPVALRDHGIGTALLALADDRTAAYGIAIEVEAAAAETLGQRTQAALYEIVREALEGSIRRGPPTVFTVKVRGSRATSRSSSTTTRPASVAGGRSRCSRSGRGRSARRCTSSRARAERACGSCSPATRWAKIRAVDGHLVFVWKPSGRNAPAVENAREKIPAKRVRAEPVREAGRRSPKVEVLVLVGLRKEGRHGADDGQGENDTSPGDGEAVLLQSVPGFDARRMPLFGGFDAHSNLSLGFISTCTTSAARFRPMIRPAYRMTVPRTSV